ncbi:MAG TPA: anti-sigma factor [Mycobacteriales bacterium]
MTAHSEWEALAAGHAFNALEPEDEVAFLAHLAGCDRCRRDLEAYEGVGAGMAYAAEPAEPPADLGRRIMDAAMRERPPVPVRARQGRRLAPPPRPPRQSVTTVRLRTLAGVAAVVFAFGLMVWNVSLRANTDAARAALGRRDAALRCLTAGDSAVATLAAEDDRRGTACVGGGKAYVFVDRLTPNGPGSVYVLWWQDATEGLHAVERFDVASSGTGVFELPARVDPKAVRGLAISLEPGRALPATPTQRIAYGAVRA